MSKLDRRNFLKSATLASAGAALVPGILKGEPSEKSSPKNVLKNTVNLAFIGVGLRGRNHLYNASKRDDVNIREKIINAWILAADNGGWNPTWPLADRVGCA